MRPEAQFKLALDSVVGAAKELGLWWAVVAAVAAAASPFTVPFEGMMLGCVRGFLDPRLAVAGVLAGVATGIVPFLVVWACLRAFKPGLERMLRADWSRVLFLSICAQIFLTMLSGYFTMIFAGVHAAFLAPAARATMGGWNAHVFVDELVGLAGWARGFKDSMLAFSILAFVGGEELSSALGDALRSVMAAPVFVFSLIAFSRVFHALDFALRPPLASRTDLALDAVLAVATTFLLLVAPLWASVNHPARLRA